MDNKHCGMGIGQKAVNRTVRSACPGGCKYRLDQDMAGIAGFVLLKPVTVASNLTSF
ncbi:MAG: hypothetical protein HOC63_00015 [Rhodospirillales bacterium]|nr:hypothetical protein [Rhodospirillales bacterium]MBT4040319.1 hypothetical protein [Rhodospirillales bacterium]MBT4625046.1 hypothetical protein [Rhodospirillales bacterium]MBT5353175.1 hypothetical protein [Rhodospirillales bacterium]MBT6111065.1 hypothetical protein [Rhodospirillales bacterium]